MVITSPRAEVKRPGRSVPPVSDVKSPAPLLEWLRQIAAMVNDIVNLGATNAIGEVTLTANATTTTLTDARIGGQTKLFFTPTTANARTAGIPAVTAKMEGSATLTHASSADTDQTFDYVVKN